MYNSIRHFVKYGIPQLEENQKTYMKNPSLLGEYAVRVKQIMLELGCRILFEMVEECNTMLEDSVKCKIHWQIKDRSEKHLLTFLGTISFPHTRFEHKTTGETAYLLDRILGLSPHARLSEDAKASLLEEAAQSSYEKASRLSGGEGRVSRETMMRHVRRIHAPSYKKEAGGEKRRVKYLYVEADEDHIALQFHKKKGDIKRWKGHGDNGQIIKLVYVHEGYEEAEGKRKQLKEWQRKRGKDWKKRKRLEERVGYLEKNWKGIRMRIKREEGVMGSSTESHISHVLSARMSSRPMGWSKEGAGKLSELRIYWKNGRKAEELLGEKRRNRGKKKREYTVSRM